MDSETLRWAMQRWFVRMRDVVEAHGGTVENYIGDAVMAVFGIPVAHEDDALRAVRAAATMREQVAALRDELRAERGVELSVRIGVNTGEAVTGDAAAGGFFTAGDIVNVAARLEQSAPARRHPCRARHLSPGPPRGPGRRRSHRLAVKGKQRARSAAFRLLHVAPDALRAPAAPARADGRPRRASATQPDRRLRAGGRASVLPAADRPGRRGRRQVSPRRRGDRRAGRSRDGGRRAAAFPTATGSPGGRSSRRWAHQRPVRAGRGRCRAGHRTGGRAAQAGRRAGRARRGVLGHPQGCSRPSRGAGRWCSSSTTSTGPSRRSWTSWST